MKVPLLNLKAQYLAIKSEIDTALAEVLQSQHFILGPKVEECERAIAQYCKCSHAVGVSSGSDALLACLMAENIGPGDEVITTSYTFFATAGAISRVGATPVFIDIDPATYNLDTAQLESKITSRTRVIIPVHLYGQMAEMDTVMRAAGKHGLVVIEDAAQALGAEYRGRRAGSIGHYGCFSFFPSKNLGAAGDAGMVVTNDAERAERLACLRGHGAKPKYHHKIIGGNFRLDAIQAAIVTVKLRHLDNWTAARQRNAKKYEELFLKAELTNPAKGASKLALPSTITNRHIFNQYVIRVANRDQLQSALKSQGIGTEVYYPVPMHLQECFQYLGYRAGSLPESEVAAKETLALPVYPELSEEQADYVVNCIRDFFTEDQRDDVIEASGSPTRVNVKNAEECGANGGQAFPRNSISEDLTKVPSTEFKKAMGKFASGVTVVSAKAGGITRGMTVSAFFSLSIDPPLIAIALHKKSKLNSLLQEATDFGVSILASHQAPVSDHFAGRCQELVEVQFAELDGVPIIQGALVHICCRIAAQYDGGDHTIYTGLVHAVEYREDCEGLVYCSGSYRALDGLAKSTWQRPKGDLRAQTADGSEVTRTQ